MRDLSLPTVLDALEKPISLPPSLLAKAREIREHDAPPLIEQYLEVIEELSSQNSNTLDEVIQLALTLEQNVSRRVVGDWNSRRGSGRGRGFPGRMRVEATAVPRG